MQITFMSKKIYHHAVFHRRRYAKSSTVQGLIESNLCVVIDQHRETNKSGHCREVTCRKVTDSITVFNILSNKGITFCGQYMQVGCYRQVAA